MAIETDLDNELLLYPVFGIATAVSLGLVETATIPVFGDFLGDIVFTTGDIEWSIARSISLGSLLFVLLNRDRSLSETRGIDLYLTYATIALIVAPPFVGTLEELLGTGGFAAIIAWIAQSYAYAAISFVN